MTPIVRNGAAGRYSSHRSLWPTAFPHRTLSRGPRCPLCNDRHSRDGNWPFPPPFGVGYYAACAISRINPDEGMKPIVGYMVSLLIGTLIVAAVPWISIGFL